jgi:hypothetical protein
LGHSERPSSPELTCAHRTGLAEPKKTAAERDRSEASIGSDQTLPLAHSAKSNPPPSLPARIRPVPRSPKKPQRSGIGPKRALEAIKPTPSRTARNLILPRAYLRASDRSRGAQKTAAERDRSEASIGSDQTLPLAHSAKTNPPPSLPARIGPVPRSPPSNSARFTPAISLIPLPA